MPATAAASAPRRRSALRSARRSQRLPAIHTAITSAPYSTYWGRAPTHWKAKARPAARSQRARPRRRKSSQARSTAGHHRMVSIAERCWTCVATLPMLAKARAPASAAGVEAPRTRKSPKAKAASSVSTSGG
jgi:hypothetical protein